MHGELLADRHDLLVQVLFGLADRAVPVDVVRDLLAEIRERGGLRAVGQHAGVGSASIHICQSSPPITATVPSISSCVAGSSVTSRIVSLSVSRPRNVTDLPTGLSVELIVSPVFGCVRRGAARL
jgi:hypothetical protein